MVLVVCISSSLLPIRTFGPPDPHVIHAIISSMTVTIALLLSLVVRYSYEYIYIYIERERE